MSFSRAFQWYHSHLDPIWPDGTFKERRHRPSITTQISPGWVTVLQPARRASLLGHLSSHRLQPHWVLSYPSPHWSLPAERDLTRDRRWSTYYESVLSLSKVSFRGKCASTGHPLKLPSPTKLARLGHFPQLARRAATPARCSMYISFLWFYSYGPILYLVKLQKYFICRW